MKDLENGPIMNRRCTDIPCCLLFIAFICGFGFTAVYGMQRGDPDKLWSGWSADGTNCGYDGNQAYPFLYWPNVISKEMVTEAKKGEFGLITEYFKAGTCVKECPMDDMKPVECIKLNIMTTDSKYREKVNDPSTATCTEWITEAELITLGTKIEDFVAAQASIYDDRFPFRYDTQTIGGFCVPDLEKAGEDMKNLGEDILKYFYEDIAGDGGQAAIADIAAAGPVIAWSCLTALILGYAFLFIIRLIGGLIIYLFLILLELTLVFAGLYVHFHAQTYADDDEYKQYIQYGAYIIWGLAAIEFLCVCCCWTQIKIAVAVYKTTAQYVAANLRIFLLPLVAWVLLGVWAIVWMTSFVHIASVGDMTPRKGLEFTTEMMWTEEARYMVWYQVFALLWVAAFINGICQFIIAASACMWYFTVNSDTKGRGTVGTAFYWAFRYHMGSVAFGSFIIALVQFIRIMFEWYRRKMAKASRDNKVVKALLCLTGYCLYILEKCVKFISKNAYIQVALTNDHFCKAAWNAFSLIVANAGRFGMATSVGAILNFFGVACIGAINGTVAFFVITESDYAPGVKTPAYPIIIVVFISIMIANTFLSIFGFSSDAILQSFLLDESLRFQGSSRPEHMQEFAEQFSKEQKGGCC